MSGRRESTLIERELASILTLNLVECRKNLGQTERLRDNTLSCIICQKHSDADSIICQ